MNSLETQVLRLAGESVSSPDVFTDDAAGIAQIRGSINDAIQELCMVTGSYRRTYHLALLADRQFYRLAPKDDYLGWIVGVWDRNMHRRLDRTDLLALSNRDPWWMKTNGPPLSYMQLGLNHIGIYMAPSAKGTILELDCVMIPAPYADAKQPVKLRNNFQRAAIYYAVSEFFASRGDAKRGSEYFDRYIETAGLMQLRPWTAERQYRYGGYEQRTNVEVIK